MTASLHVAVVTETYPPEVNGVAMTLGRMVHGLLERGHRVSLTRPRQHAADVPPTTPGMSTTLVRGLPVVAYRMAAAAQLIRHGDNGMLADPGASDQFVRAALDLVCRPQARRRMAMAAPSSVAALDWEYIHEQLVAALRDAIDRPAPPAARQSIFSFRPD